MAADLRPVPEEHVPDLAQRARVCSAIVAGLGLSQTFTERGPTAVLAACSRSRRCPPDMSVDAWLILRVAQGFWAAATGEASFAPTSDELTALGYAAAVDYAQFVVARALGNEDQWAEARLQAGAAY